MAKAMQLTTIWASQDGEAGSPTARPGPSHPPPAPVSVSPPYAWRRALQMQPPALASGLKAQPCKFHLQTGRLCPQRLPEEHSGTGGKCTTARDRFFSKSNLWWVGGAGSEGGMVQSKPPPDLVKHLLEHICPSEVAVCCSCFWNGVDVSIFGCCAVSKPPKGFEFPESPSLMTHSYPSGQKPVPASHVRAEAPPTSEPGGRAPSSGDRQVVDRRPL